MSTDSRHCCEEMTRQVTSTCDRHPDRFDCPDCLVYYSKRSGNYGIIIHDGGNSFSRIAFCPWCGAKLLDREPG